MIGENIKNIRLRNDITQIELAKRLGVSNKTICSWESNRTEPNMVMIEQLANALLCTKTAIIYGMEDAPAAAPAADPLHKKIDRLDDVDKIRAEAYVDGLLSADKYQKNISAGTA